MNDAQLLAAAIGGLVLALLAVRSRAATPAGAAVGWLLLMAYASAPGPAPLSTFVLFVVLGSLSSRWGRATKRARGADQDEEGVRGVSNALANGGVGAAVLVFHLALGLPSSSDLAQLAACAAVGACLSDTIATEFGTWLGGTPRNILSGRKTRPGQDGSVTGVGLLASAVAALLVAALVGSIGPADVRLALLVAVAAYAGNLADSVLGATLEPAFGKAGNHVVNALASLTGALVLLATA